MRIAFVVEHCNLRGGHERCVAEWARRLAQRHEVTVISHSLADLPPHTVQWKQVKQIPGPAPLAFLGFYVRAGAMARSLSDHIIHSQGPNCPHFHVSSVHTVIQAKLDVLRTSREFRHELTCLQYMSWLAHYRLAAKIEKRLYSSPQGILAPVSSGTAQEILRIYEPPEGAVHVVPNGVDLEAFHPGVAEERVKTLFGLELDPDRRYALFVGGEWARKGLPAAIGVISKCSSDVHLIVAGRGPVEFYANLAATWGVRERIHFVGPVTDPAALYRTGFVLLSPSLYEAFSLVSLEAAASGLPLIASPVSGTDELIESGENGWILPPDDRLWAEKLDELAENASLSEMMGTHARETASQFTWDRAVEEFEKIYAIPHK